VTAARVADLDRRFYAFVVDRLVAWPVLALAAYAGYRLSWRDGGVWPGVLLLLLVVLAVGGGAAALLVLRAATPGKALLGLRVIDDDTGRAIGFVPALKRVAVVGVASLPTFGLGAATLAQTAALDPDHRRRGWHDRLAGSIVVDVRPPPAVEPAAADAASRQVVNLTAMGLAPASVAGVHRAPGPDPVDARWRITVDTGETLPVAGHVLLGRRPQARPGEQVGRLVALTSGDMSVSKTHAELQLAEDGALLVTDRGSTNGSALVRDGVSRDLSAGKPATLLPGDVVVLGDRRLTVSRED
jgi:uncharacterized RDD family membrane protein YckC